MHHVENISWLWFLLNTIPNLLFKCSCLYRQTLCLLPEIPRWTVWIWIKCSFLHLFAGVFAFFLFISFFSSRQVSFYLYSYCLYLHLDCLLPYHAIISQLLWMKIVRRKNSDQFGTMTTEQKTTIYSIAKLEQNDKCLWAQ